MFNEITNTISPNKEGARWEKIYPIRIYLPFICNISLGNGTQVKLITFWNNDRLFVGIERVGCFLFPTSNWISPKYIMKKLGWNNEADCACLADWINMQIDQKTEEFGHYFLFDDEEEDYKE